jgi:hypothetical protein
MSLKNDMKSHKKPLKNLPDPSICRAVRLDGPGLVACLVGDARDCQHVGFFDENAFCLNPKREEIIIQTMSRR